MTMMMMVVLVVVILIWQVNSGFFDGTSIVTKLAPKGLAEEAGMRIGDEVSTSHNSRPTMMTMMMRRRRVATKAHDDDDDGR